MVVNLVRWLTWLAGVQVYCVTCNVQMDEENGMIETLTRGESSICEAGNVEEPSEGMLFESEEAARGFYDDYARQTGFVTRVLSSRKSERDGSIISRGLGCRGFSDNQTKVQEQKKHRRREACTAMILLKRDKTGRWVVRKFVRDHIHPLVVQLQTSRRTLVSSFYLACN